MNIVDYAAAFGADDVWVAYIGIEALRRRMINKLSTGGKVTFVNTQHLFLIIDQCIRDTARYDMHFRYRSLDIFPNVLNDVTTYKARHLSLLVLDS